MATAISEVESEQRFLIQDADWETYQQLRAAFGNRQIRVTYDRGRLELMSPSFLHERYNHLFRRLIETLTEEFNMPVLCCGSTTFSKDELERGLEPDCCFYIQSEEQIRSLDEINLDVDPPPDLAVEIDVTRSSLDRMGIYAALGVPEVWRYDTRSLEVNVLSPQGVYEQREQSPTFPSVPLEGIERFIKQRKRSDENAWIRSFREWIRNSFADDG